MASILLHEIVIERDYFLADFVELGSVIPEVMMA